MIFPLLWFGLKTPPWNVSLGCCFGAPHKSSFLVAADHSVTGGGISSTILENHSVLSELTLRFLTENRQALYEFFMQGLLPRTSKTAAVLCEKKTSMRNSSYSLKSEEKCDC